MKSTFQHGFSAWENGHHKWEQFSWIISCQRRRRPFDQHNSWTFFFFRCNRGGGVHTGKYTKGKKKKKMAQKNEMEKKKKKKKVRGWWWVDGKTIAHVMSLYNTATDVFSFSLLSSLPVYSRPALSLVLFFFSSCANQLGVPTPQQHRRLLI